jgi:hypothetical protein
MNKSILSFLGFRILRRAHGGCRIVDFRGHCIKRTRVLAYNKKKIETDIFDMNVSIVDVLISAVKTWFNKASRA